MMLHHLFKNLILTDLMWVPNRLLFDTQQKAYSYCQKYYFDHKLDFLNINNLVKIFNDKSETESLDKKNKNLNVEDM